MKSSHLDGPSNELLDASLELGFQHRSPSEGFVQGAVDAWQGVSSSHERRRRLVHRHAAFQALYQSRGAHSRKCRMRVEHVVNNCSASNLREQLLGDTQVLVQEHWLAQANQVHLHDGHRGSSVA